MQLRVVEVDCPSSPFLGRWFVQLWSQFRYGIYDEHGYAGDKSYPYFYLDEKMTIPMPTACSTADLLLGDVM